MIVSSAEQSVAFPAKRPAGSALEQDGVAPPSGKNYAWAFAACAMMTGIATPLIEVFELSNIVMLFLLVVVLVAAYLGRGPAVLASFLSVASFDFFFVPPRFSFTVNDPQYLVTFVVMLAVALVIGQLTGGLERQARIAVKKERRAHALYEIARALTGALTTAQVTEITCRFLHDATEVEATLLLPDDRGQLKPMTELSGPLQAVSPMMTSHAYGNTACSDLDAPHPIGYFPLKAPTRVHGVMAIASPDESTDSLYEHQEFFKTVASLVAIAIEQLHYVTLVR